MSSLARVIPLLFLVLILSAVLLVPPAYAADFRGGDRVAISADQVIDDDLYIAAQEIVIDGTVNGDVYAVGQSITINGTVNYDVNAAAQIITINGTVGSDARLAAQVVVLGASANIARTTQLASFSVETEQNSRIGNDLLFVAYQALLSGNVGKDVVAGGNGIELRGMVGRNMRVSVGDSSSASFSPRMFMTDMPISVPTVPFGLTIAPSAVIGGDLIYESQQSARVESGSQVTGPVVQQTPVPRAQESAEPLTPAAQQAQLTQALVDNVFNQVRRFVVLLLLGLLALWLLPKFVSALAEAIRTKPLGSLGRGVLMVVGFIFALIVITLAAIVLAILFGILTLGSLAGLSIATGIVALAVLAFAYGVFTSYVAPIVVSYLIGRAIFDRTQASWAQNRFIVFVVGLVLLSLVSLVPILNVFIGILVAIFALGALALWLGPRWRGRQTVAAQPV